MALKPLTGCGRVCSSLILHAVGKTCRTGDEPVTRPLLHKGQHRMNTYKYLCLDWDSRPWPQISRERRQCLRPRRHCGQHISIANNTCMHYTYLGYYNADLDQRKKYLMTDTMMTNVFWDKAPSAVKSGRKDIRRFSEMHCIYLQGRRIGVVRKNQAGNSKILLCYLLAS
jgi:hypothetical protein